MIKIEISEENKTYRVEKNEDKTNTVEHLILINTLIGSIMEHNRMSYRKVIRLIKRAKKEYDQKI